MHSAKNGIFGRCYFKQFNVIHPSSSGLVWQTISSMAACKHLHLIHFSTSSLGSQKQLKRKTPVTERDRTALQLQSPLQHLHIRPRGVIRLQAAGCSHGSLRSTYCAVVGAKRSTTYNCDQGGVSQSSTRPWPLATWWLKGPAHDPYSWGPIRHISHSLERFVHGKRQALIRSGCTMPATPGISALPLRDRCLLSSWHAHNGTGEDTEKSQSSSASLPGGSGEADSPKQPLPCQVYRKIRSMRSDPRRHDMDSDFLLAHHSLPRRSLTPPRNGRRMGCPDKLGVAPPRRGTEGLRGSQRSMSSIFTTQHLATRYAKWFDFEGKHLILSLNLDKFVSFRRTEYLVEYPKKDLRGCLKCSGTTSWEKSTDGR